MSWWNAVSTCWPPGQNSCVAWWDAWAVVVAVLAVVATVFLGIATLRLGRQANRLGRISVRLGRAANRSANVAVKIALEESQARAQQDRARRLLVLMQIRGEAAIAKGILKDTLDAISADGAETRFFEDASFRARIRGAVLLQKFPVAESLSDRLHYIGHPVAGHLAAAMAVVQNWSRIYPNVATREATAKENDWTTASEVVQLVYGHITHVDAACNAAAVEAGVVPAA